MHLQRSKRPIWSIISNVRKAWNVVKLQGQTKAVAWQTTLARLHFWQRQFSAGEFSSGAAAKDLPRFFLFFSFYTHSIITLYPPHTDTHSQHQNTNTRNVTHFPSHHLNRRLAKGTPDFVPVPLIHSCFKGVVRLKRAELPRFFICATAALHRSAAGIWMRQI